ncbi:hypothetical protein JSE7799_03459 [Jannaschia seosinensis]|uniref:Bacterial lipoprotein (DUF940) n=1 Tax=Jannaschia seosinensis TaxID=313367 RepID=A0A0M7BFU6_9RHOB|nr:YjbH domain-containing protein [Jannaschia seosinensis]CUH40724.1 hypothetical protein JSE7799_03459 [Jannaschia seosinensis]
MSIIRTVTATFAALSVGMAAPAGAEFRPINSYGVPGLVDMPSAQMQPDAELTTSIAILSNEAGRVQVAFQFTPRLQALFRYATIPDFLGDGRGGFDRTYDRSFDLRYQFLTETARRPAVTVGVQDIGGTSLYAGEYVVATKTLGTRWTVTGGIGWGRFGTRGGFDNPLGVLDDRFDDRGEVDFGRGGNVQVDNIFRGDAALFGGLQYRWDDRLTLNAEYSSDAYEEEEARGIFEAETPLNFGLDYRINDGARLGAYVLNGAEVGMTLQLALNPKRAPQGSGREGAPVPVTLRPARAEAPELWRTDWAQGERVPQATRAALDQVLEAQGLDLVATRLEPARAEIRFVNRTYPDMAQAIGRAARAATAALPPSVETLVLVPLNRTGIAGDAVILSRSDIEALENAPDGVARIQARARSVDVATLGRAGLVLQEEAYPRLNWNIGPYVSLSTFDPDNPIRADLGVSLSAGFQPRAGVLFEGAVNQRVIGNRDQDTRFSPSELPRVRTDTNRFAQADGPFIPYLTGNYFFRPGRDLYGRLTAGLLERQYGGVSAEMLWMPAASRFALGAEVNSVRQRDFDMGLGFRDLDATTAFVTGYYNHGGGYRSRLDVGQYLAGDQGATYRLSREFANGWQVSAYATKTNVTSDEFGEGSFDKGISLSIPLGFFTGEVSRRRLSTTIQPILRDGGARLSVRKRLYHLVSDQSEPELTSDWGRIWR